VTTRAGGVSEGEYGTMNLGARGGDDPANVASNRDLVANLLPGTPRWLAQVHGAEVADLDRTRPGTVTADAAVTHEPGTVAVVLTADCMPLLLCDRAGAVVAVAHAGWRGMAAGVIERTVETMRVKQPRDVIAWMGPTIGPDAFEVGPEVREAFMSVDRGARSAFREHTPGKYMADLYALARQRLARAGVTDVHGGGFCTFREADRFFSYRRVPQSGRMGAFAWLE
jgi:YfiH family protein